MNKKFSTLLMGGLLMAGAASAQTPKPIERSLGPAVTEPSAKFYYQIVNGETGAEGYALQAAIHTNGADSLKAVKVTDLNAALNGSDVEKAIEAMATLDSTLWAFTPNGDENLGYYSIVNKATGKKLQFAKEGNAIMGAGLNAWFIEEENTYNDVKLQSYVINADGSKTSYSIESNRTTGGPVTIAKGNANAKYKIVRPGHIYMNAAQLNAEGDGNSFKMAIEDLVDTENPFVKTALKAYDLSAQNGQKNIGLKVVDGKILKADADKYTGDAKYNTNVYVVVDTTMYASKGGVDVNGTDAFGFKFAVDSATVDAEGKITSNIQAPGRNVTNYRFAIYKDVTLVGEDDQLLVKLLGVPTYDKEATGSKFTKTPQVSYVSWAGFAEKGDELTTARISRDNQEYVYELPVITLAAGAKADIAPGVYYIKFKDAKYAYANMSLTSTNSWTPDYTEATPAVNMNNDLLARTQYVVTGANGKYTIVNRESGEPKISGRIYVKDGKFIQGAQTFELESVPAEVAADNHVGYKFFSKEEVGNLAVALKFNSKIGSAFMVDAKQKVSVDADAELADASFFKMLPVDTVAFGVDMEYGVYKLYKQYTKEFLKADGTVSENNGLSNVTLDTEANASLVVFRSTGKEGEYQIIFAGDDVYNAPKMYDQLSVLATEAKFNKLKVDDANAVINGFWTLETPAAPDYLTIEDAPAHKRIFSSENTSLAISMNADRTGILKAVADKGDYLEDQFKMWVDTACVENAEKPLYYIATCAGLDEETREEGHMMYMVPTEFKENIAQVEFKEGYVFGADSLALAKYKNGAVEKFEDKKVMAENPAAFAFQMTPAEGEYVVENIATKSYLRQVNGVLYLTKMYEDALTFGIEATDTPTANEGVEVSEVTVIAGEGNVTIAGAAGKKVVVSNILGQVVANTVITSDNATIAAPAGVVVVAVEGEEAVKAIIK